VTALGERLVALYRAMEDKASAAIAGDLRRFNAELRSTTRASKSR